MNFHWVVQRLKEGEKVRRPSWKENSYWMLGIDESIVWANEKPAIIHLKQIHAKDWELYDENNLESLVDFLIFIKKKIDNSTKKELDDALKYINKLKEKKDDNL